MTIRGETRLSEEERKFLYSCLKSKNIPTLKRTVMKEKLLNKIRTFINFRRRLRKLSTNLIIVSNNN